MFLIAAYSELGNKPITAMREKQPFGAIFVRRLLVEHIKSLTQQNCAIIFVANIFLVWVIILEMK